MDPMLAKLIESRRASIVVLEKDIADLRALRSASTVPEVANSFAGIIKVKEQRLLKLQKELRGFVLASGQSEIPGTEAAPPVVRKPGR